MFENSLDFDCVPEESSKIVFSGSKQVFASEGRDDSGFFNINSNVEFERWCQVNTEKLSTVVITISKFEQEKLNRFPVPMFQNPWLLLLLLFKHRMASLKLQ
jgi:hypothetical protein